MSKQSDWRSNAHQYPQYHPAQGFTPAAQDVEPSVESCLAEWRKWSEVELTYPQLCALESVRALCLRRPPVSSEVATGALEELLSRVRVTGLRKEVGDKLVEQARAELAALRGAAGW